MKNKIKLTAIPLLAALLITGCVSTDHVAKPSNITLANALKEVGRGLAEMKVAEIEALAKNETLRRLYGDDFITGLFPSEVSVTFNVTAGASKANQLSIDLNASAPGVPVSGKVGDTFTSSSTASRGNQITIKFQSALFTQTTTTTTLTNGTKISVEQKITDAKTLTDFLNVIKTNHIVRAK